MLGVSLFARRSAPWFAAIFLGLTALPVEAAIIDLSLNLTYANPANSQSGGTWQLVGKSDGQGLAAVTARISGIATAQNAAPRGVVNGTDPAGFGIFANTVHPLGFNNITIGQAPIAARNLGPGEEQSVFYGVGTLANGAPNYPGKPVGSNSIGPAFTSLSNVSGVAWATTNLFNDPAWVTAATLATGTFLPGVTPNFFQNEQLKSGGDIFTALDFRTDDHRQHHRPHQLDAECRLQSQRRGRRGGLCAVAQHVGLDDGARCGRQRERHDRRGRLRRVASELWRGDRRWDWGGCCFVQ
jgi:hypothetical protein